jgi:hypothetical protein
MKFSLLVYTFASVLCCYLFVNVNGKLEEHHVPSMAPLAFDGGDGEHEVTHQTRHQQQSQPQPLSLLPILASARFPLRRIHKKENANGNNKSQVKFKYANGAWGRIGKRHDESYSNVATDNNNRESRLDGLLEKLHDLKREFQNYRRLVNLYR